MERRFIYNKTINNCLIIQNETYQNSSYMDYDSCPDTYNKSRLYETDCCVKIFKNYLNNLYENERKIIEWLAYNSSTFLFIPSIILNMLSFLVLTHFTRLNRSATSISFYMQCLSIFDALTMFSKFLNEFIVVGNLIRKSPIKISVHFCKIYLFLESTVSTTSIYLILLMSIDKFISVAFPLKSKYLLRPKRARINVVILLLISMIYSAYYLINSTSNIYSSKTDNGMMYHCTLINHNFDEIYKIFSKIATVFAPILLLCICNIFIFIFLLKANKRRKFILNESLNETCSSTPMHHSSRVLSKNEKDDDMYTKNDIQSNNENSKNYRNNNKNSVPKSDSKNSHHVSVMLFTISIGFIVLNLPCAILILYEINFDGKKNILYYYSDKDYNFSKSDFDVVYKFEIYVFVAYFLKDLNYIANFFFYYFSGSKFRKMLYTLIITFFKKLKNFNCTPISKIRNNSKLRYNRRI